MEVSSQKFWALNPQKIIIFSSLDAYSLQALCIFIAAVKDADLA